MSAKKMRPRLSKGILEMKFMRRTKNKVDKELEEEEGRKMYANEISDKMLQNSNFIMEPSIASCEALIEGRLSFRGMNPEIERLLELENAEREAAKRRVQPNDVSDQEMAAFYHQQAAPGARKFQRQSNEKKRPQQNGKQENKKMKILKKE